MPYKGSMASALSPMKRRNQANAWANSNRDWTAEVAAVLAAEGLPWQATSCWCDQRTATWCAELTHTATGQLLTVTVPAGETMTPAARRAEIVRQTRAYPTLR
jgi:hypothetical protein